jgi:prophage antirepressor-like protein
LTAARARQKVGAIVDKIVALGAPAVTTEDGEMWFSLTAAVQALGLAVDDPEAAPQDENHPLHRVATCATLMELTNAEGEGWTMISLKDILAHLTPFSPAPEARDYHVWLCSAFLPALLRTGHYDPQTGHAPPPGQELDALERREQGRDVLNAVAPGLGDTWANHADLPDDEAEHR